MLGLCIIAMEAKMRDFNEININEGGVPINRPAPCDEEIQDFEKKFNIKLPDDYIKLLKYANGGHPQLDSFLVKDQDENNRWSVDKFYHLDSNINAIYNLWKMNEEWQKVLGKNAITIAIDGGGNQIFLDIKSSDHSIMLCIHDENYKIIEVADSFEEFIDRLEEHPDYI